jgi:hypothetical protein
MRMRMSEFPGQRDCGCCDDNEAERGTSFPNIANFFGGTL